ncbi:substrate-binding periplasmic protein [Mangrovitalea sediminis]|uniref:substrate-binding periplasmic protein n=1 Tax=Mangrovitalea sediminis TaxID=1982043 RepID=UPI000BE51D6A|nr:transporter substrate-binding domain-containing protein [Mangrovitalea sediminis]
MLSGLSGFNRFCRMLLLVLLGTLPAVAQSKTLVIGADLWCPYNCTPGSSHPGYVVEVARAVFEPLGIKVVYRNIPWQRAKRMLEKGTLQGLIAATPANIADLKVAPVFPRESVGRMHNSFYTLASSHWQFAKAPSLDDIRLGVVDGYDYGPHVQPYITRWKGSERVLAITGTHAVARLQTLMRMGRVDVILEDDDVFRYTAGQLGFEDYRKAGAVTAPQAMDNLFIAFSPVDPKAADYAKMLSQGVQRLRRSGELARILKRYGLTDWK